MNVCSIFITGSSPPRLGTSHLFHSTKSLCDSWEVQLDLSIVPRERSRAAGETPCLEIVPSLKLIDTARRMSGQTAIDNFTAKNFGMPTRLTSQTDVIDLDEKLKRSSARQLRSFMCYRIRPALCCRLIAQKLSKGLLGRCNPLKSQMGQNVKSPFSNIRAVTSKLHPCSSRRTPNCCPVPKSP